MTEQKKPSRMGKTFAERKAARLAAEGKAVRQSRPDVEDKAVRGTTKKTSRKG